MQSNYRIVVGVTGASGVIMAYYLLQALKQENIKVYLIISNSAKLTWKSECNIALEELTKLSYKVYNNDDISAIISSGSCITSGMIIIPCSMKTLAGIASGYSDNLILRAADVCIKENRKLIVVPREMPLSKLHLRNLKEIADNGCVVIPPVLTFYNNSKTVEDHINNIIGKILQQFDIRYNKFKEWNPNI